jgi:hypothetical protein
LRLEFADSYSEYSSKSAFEPLVDINIFQIFTLKEHYKFSENFLMTCEYTLNGYY